MIRQDFLNLRLTLTDYSGSKAYILLILRWFGSMNRIKNNFQIRATRYCWCISSMRAEAVLSNMIIIIIGGKMKLP